MVSLFRTALTDSNNISQRHNCRYTDIHRIQKGQRAAKGTNKFSWEKFPRNGKEDIMLNISYGIIYSGKYFMDKPLIFMRENAHISPKFSTCRYSMC